MSEPLERVEVITGRERRRRYTAEEKVRLVEETTRPGMTVSAVARLSLSCSAEVPRPRCGRTPP
jgi:transposase